MYTTTYEHHSSFSEQETKDRPQVSATYGRPNASFHALLLRQALLRSRVQSAISELIRGYEATSGFSVIRVDLESRKSRVILDAIPAPEGSLTA